MKKIFLVNKNQKFCIISAEIFWNDAENTLFRFKANIRIHENIKLLIIVNVNKLFMKQ